VGHPCPRPPLSLCSTSPTHTPAALYYIH